MQSQQVEKVIVSHRTIACDGGGGALGHPTVYLTMEPPNQSVECPYCSRLFLLDPKVKTASGH